MVRDEEIEQHRKIVEKLCNEYEQEHNMHYNSGDFFDSAKYAQSKANIDVAYERYMEEWHKHEKVSD